LRVLHGLTNSPLAALGLLVSLPLLAAVPARAQWVEPPGHRLADLPVVDHFQSPVGDPADFTLPAEGERQGFRVVRGVRSRGRPHRGLDLSNRGRGSAVRAPAAGLVLESGRFEGWGNLVVLAHRLPGGEYVASLLAHLQKGSVRVEVGDRVEAGQEIGRVGSTGRATGPHVHLEVRRLGVGDPRLVSWREGEVLDPIAVLSTDLAQALAPGRAPSDHWGWAYLRRVAGLGSQVFGLGDPDALLTRREFYSWTARATGDSATARTPAARVEARLALLGLGELLSGVSSVASTMDAGEAAQALGELAMQGWLRPLQPAAGADALKLLHDRGLAPIAGALKGSPLPPALPARPLTRAEGALLILAARTQSEPQAASR
jgi:hypothetical protein